MYKMTVQKHSCLMGKPLSRTVIYRNPEQKRFHEGILFVDTECEPENNYLYSIQLRYNGKNYLYKIPEDLDKIGEIADMWNNAKAVVMWNAPFDMGQVSKRKLPGNNWEYVTEINNKQDKYGEPMKFSYTRMEIFGNVYKVKRLNRHSNFIRVDGKGTPVIDLLKLFYLFVRDKKLSLKETAVDYLGREMIPYTKASARTEAYQKQDVEALDGLWCFFEDIRQDIDDVRDFTYEELMKLDSTASCTKREYRKRFPKMREWRDENDMQDELFGLRNPLEQGFLGGLTCALHHGTVKGVSAEDIKGSYDAVIIHENTDQYNRYNWEKIDPPKEFPENGCPIFCKVWTNIVMRHIEDSLKIFKLRRPKDMWYWSYDKIALETIFGDEANIIVTEAYRPVPLCDVKESLACMWHARKVQIENDPDYGKGHPLRLYYKTLSNASYGICAQRRHGRTEFTNMVKAGIITARARLTLAKMIKVARDMGCRWIYSDTDSVFVELNGVDPVELEKAMKAAIYPYECECDFVGDMYISSLKRYIAANGVDLKGEKVKDKIRLHGRGPFNIEEEDVLRMQQGKPIEDDELKISNLSANTELTMKMVKKLMKADPKDIEESPYMFVTNVPKNMTKHDWYRRYRRHCDSKMDVPEGATYEMDFERHFMTFDTYDEAVEFFKQHKCNDLEIDELLMYEDDEVDWDNAAMKSLPELYEQVVEDESQ